MANLKHYDAPVYSMPEDDLKAYYKKIASTADSRLRMLEHLSEEEDYAVATQWAYKRALRDIHKWSGEAAKRFNTAPPPNLRDLQKKVTEIEEFLNAPTSSKVGIKSVYKSKSDTYSEKYDIKISWNQVADFFESETYKSLEEKGYGSKTIMISLGYMQKYGDAIKDMINEMISDEIHVTADDEMDLVEEELLKKFKQDDVDTIMEYMYASDPDVGVIIRVAELMKIDFPGIRKSKDGEGYTKQDLRNLKNMAKDRGIKWEELF